MASKRYDVMYPRQYKDSKDQVQTAFVRVGVAFPLREKDGLTLELHVPLVNVRKLVLFVHEPKQTQETPADDDFDAEAFDRG